MAIRISRKCAAQNCLNNNGDNLTFYRFPKDKERAIIWAQAAMRNDLIPNAEKLYNSHRLCAAHFKKKYFLNDFRNRLMPNAIPTIFQTALPLNHQNLAQENIENDPFDILILNNNKGNKMDQATQTYFVNLENAESQTEFEENFHIEETNKGFTTRGIQTSSYWIHHHKITEDLKHKNKELQNRTHYLEHKIKNLEEKTKTRQLSLDEWSKHCETFLSPECATFVQNQALLYKKKGFKYSNELKKFSLELYFKGPKLYNQLRSIFHLPTKRTLNRSIQNVSFEVGLNENLFNNLLMNISNFEELDKYCVLCVDEMALKAHLYYDISKDKVLGFTDLGDQQLFEPCFSATVFLIRGIYKNWKLPICYLLPRTTCVAEKLKPILLKCIKKLKKVGLIVCIVISDMGSNNIALCNLLRITPENPFFFVDNQKVFYAYDTCHLLKATRNNLLSHTYMFENNFTSWTYISKFYNYDKTKANRLCPKLTDSHIQPTNFEKMKVKYAAQIFSYSLSSAMSTYIYFGKLPEEAIGTVKFIERFDKLFDMLNSSGLKSKKEFNKPYKDTPEQKSFMLECLNFLDNVTVKNKKTGKDITRSIKSIQGWKITINAIMLLWDYLHQEGYQFLLTRRINQDALENTFGYIRQQNGNCVNPTPIQFIRSFRKLFCTRLLSYNGSENCAADFSETFLQFCNFHQCYKEETIDDVLLKDLPVQSKDYQECDIYEQNSIQYICDFLIKKCLEKHSCEVCTLYAKSQQHVDDRTLYSHFKAYTGNIDTPFGSLYIPPEIFVHFVSQMNKIFYERFEEFVIQKKVLNKFIVEFKKIDFLHPCKNFPYNYMIHLFTRMRLYFTLKFINRNFKDKNNRNKLLIWRNE